MRMLGAEKMSCVIGLRCPLMLLLALAVCLASSSCRSSPVPHFYLLELPVSGGASDSADSADNSLLVGVGRFRVEPPYDDQRLVYRPASTTPEVGFYDYHRWAVPLEEAVPAFLVRLLDRQRLVRAERLDEPRSEPGNGGYDAVVTGRVTRFEERDDGESIQVLVDLDLTIETGPGRTERLHVRSSQDVDHADVGAVVEAFVRALEEASQQLAASLR